MVSFPLGPLAAQAAPSPPIHPGSQPPEAWFGIPDGRGGTVFCEWARDWPLQRDQTPAIRMVASSSMPLATCSSTPTPKRR